MQSKLNGQTVRNKSHDGYELLRRTEADSRLSAVPAGCRSFWLTVIFLLIADGNNFIYESFLSFRLFCY